MSDTSPDTRERRSIQPMAEHDGRGSTRQREDAVRDELLQQTLRRSAGAKRGWATRRARVPAKQGAGHR